jgi:hypothetical protein
VAQANTGQTTLARTPRWARSAIYQLSVVTLAGTTRTIDYKLVHAIRKITPAVVVTETQEGGVSDDETQTISLTGGPTGGTFTITWTGVSADISVTTEPISATASVQDVRDALRRALTTSSGALKTDYHPDDIVVTRTGAGTSGDPYVYELEFSGTTVAKTDVDDVTVDGSKLYTEAATADNFNGWDGITQLTAVDDIWVNVGPFEADTADDTGPIYQVQAELPEAIGHVLAFDRTDTDETYTWSLYATYLGGS